MVIGVLLPNAVLNVNNGGGVLLCLDQERLHELVLFLLVAVLGEVQVHVAYFLAKVPYFITLDISFLYYNL